MKKVRLIFCLLLTCVFILGMTACGAPQAAAPAASQSQAAQQPQASADAPKAASDETYYTVGMHINLPYWQDHKKGLEAAAAELGVNAVFTGESGNDAAKQIDIFEQVVAKKPAGILVSPIDPEGMIPSIKKAIDAGIPVVTIDSDAENSARLCYFGTGNYNAGWAAADILANAVGKKGEVGVLTISGVMCLDERQRGFEENIKQNYPEMKVVSVQNDEGDPQKAATVTSQMLQANPNMVGLFGDDAASGVGAAAALRESNKLGKVKVVAFDKDTAVLDLVADGTIEATMVQRTFTMSYYALKFLYDYNHQNIKMATDMTGINPLPQQVDTGIIAVGKDEALKYK